MLSKKEFTRFEDYVENESLTAIWFINSLLAPRIRSCEQELERLKEITLKTDEVQDAIIKVKSQFIFLRKQRQKIINEFVLSEESIEEYNERINEFKEDN